MKKKKLLHSIFFPLSLNNCWTYITIRRLNHSRYQTKTLDIFEFLKQTEYQCIYLLEKRVRFIDSKSPALRQYLQYPAQGQN
jgi:hypothetical protein